MFFSAGIFFDDSTGRINNNGYTRKIETALIFSALIAGHHVQAVVECAGRQVAHPGIKLFRRRAPWRGMGHKNHIGTIGGHAG